MTTEPKIGEISPDETLEVCARQIIVNLLSSNDVLQGRCEGWE